MSSPNTMRSALLTAVELLVIVAAALMLTRPYLTMDPMLIPTGREYLSATQSHHLWTRVRECGLCALWNGSTRGGAPAFVDVYGGMLHPLVIITNLFGGVRNGTKIALIGVFLMGGVAQWWFARELGLGRAARTWSGCMAVVAGHISGRMELGTFGLALSTAACAFVFPPLVATTRTGNRRKAVLLGIALALAALSGQGYLQIGMIFVLPAIVFLLPLRWSSLLVLARRYALAGVLALLLAAPFVVPLLHFLPEMNKPTAPLDGQPLTFVLLNLVNDHKDFYFEHSAAMHKQIHPWLYLNYVGWIPVVLALVGLSGGRTKSEQRAILYLFTSAALALWVASDKPMAMFARWADPVPWLASQFDGLRYYPVIAGLAVPPILALSAIGLDKLLQGFPSLPPVHLWGRRIPLAWLDIRWLLLVPLAFAFLQAFTFAQNWIDTREIPSDVYPVLEALQTPDMQWVQLESYPFDFAEPSAGLGIKVSNGPRPWDWKGHGTPAYLLLARSGEETPAPPLTLVERVGDHTIYRAPPKESYAVVAHTDATFTVCTAEGRGGHIDVVCHLQQPGELVIQENQGSGWNARVDGKPVPLKDSPWLALDLPAGEHHIRLRYRPLDVFAGLGLWVVGVVLARYWWRQPPGSFRDTRATTQTPAPDR